MSKAQEDSERAEEIEEEEEEQEQSELTGINPNANEAATLIKLGAFHTQGQTLEGHNNPYAVIPSDYKILDLEPFMDHPTRIKSDTTFKYIPDMAKYIKLFKTASTMAFFTGKEIQVIFDFHTKDKPGWGSHRARYMQKGDEDMDKILSSFKDQDGMPDIFYAVSTSDAIAEIVAKLQAAADTK